MRVFTKIDEFLATKPQTSPGTPDTNPVTIPNAPPSPNPSYPNPVRREKPAAVPKPKGAASEPSVKPEIPQIAPKTHPQKQPSYPSPVRREKPAVDPKIKGENDVVKRFFMELRRSNSPIEFDINKLKQKYKK